MSFILEILRRAMGDLLTPRVLTVMFMPMLAALAVWGGLAWWFGATWLTGLESFVTGIPHPEWLAAGWLTGFAAYLLLALLLVPAIYVTALSITALAFMPLLVKVVAERHFPHLEARQGGTLLGSVANGVYALAVYMLIWILTLPFWLLGPFGLAISLILNAWLNQRLFLYDALAEHASAQELGLLRREGGWALYLLAAVLGLLHFVPVVNFFAPVYMGLAFTHYGLSRLNQLRKAGAA